MAGAIWESRPARAVQAWACMVPALGIILALAVAAKFDDWIRET